MLEYIFIIIFFLWFIPFLYVKIKYPFWSHQPIFHTYDLLRYWTHEPFIIQKNMPIKTKYLCKEVNTKEFLDLDEDEHDNIIDFIQSHYIESDKVLTMINKEDMKKDFIGYSNPSFISFYYDKQFIYNTQNVNSQYPIIEENDILGGVMTSRAVKIYLNYPTKHQQYLYYWDYLCVHREYANKYIGRNLIQNHEKHQRFHNKDIASSLFKREINLCDGVVPLVQYNVFTFPLEKSKKPPLKKYTVERIIDNNVNHIFDFLYHVTHSNNSGFQLCIFPEVQVLDGLIQNQRIFVFCLKQQSKIIGFYFFKNPKICYDVNEERNVLENIGSVLVENDNNQNTQSLFFAGLLHAIYEMQHLFSTKFKLISFYQIMNNEILIERWNWKYTPMMVTQSAYYLYNAVFPNMPYHPKNCFILL